MRSWSYTALGLLLLSAVLSPALGQWQRINGGLKHVTASVNYVWGVNSANSIYKCMKPCTGSNWVRIAGSLKQIDAGDEEVWGVNSADQIWKHPVDGSGSWRLISGRLKHVSASGNGYIWGVNSNDQIFRIMDKCQWTTQTDWWRLRLCLRCELCEWYIYTTGRWKWIMVTYSW